MNKGEQWHSEISDDEAIQTEYSTWATDVWVLTSKHDIGKKLETNVNKRNHRSSTHHRIYNMVHRKANTGALKPAKASPEELKIFEKIVALTG
jgi:hypothetical protein